MRQLPDLNQTEIDARRRELAVDYGYIGEQQAELRRRLAELDLKEASINREVAELALIEGCLPTYVAHGGGRHAG